MLAVLGHTTETSQLAAQQRDKLPLCTGKLHDTDLSENAYIAAYLLATMSLMMSYRFSDQLALMRNNSGSSSINSLERTSVK